MAAAICTVTVPVKTVSELNRHEHWRIRAKRAKAQHHAVIPALLASHRAIIFVGKMAKPGPLHVHLTRLSARKLDTDNLAGALKHCRDAVAKFLGVDDGNEAAVSWSVGQERQNGYAVRVEFYRRWAEQQPRKSQTERPPGEDCRQLASADSSDLSNTSPRARVR